MKRDNVNYFLVGLLVLVALFLLLGSLYVITGRSGPTDNYVVHYRDVSGLGFGSAVFYQGYRVGQVERIEPEQVDGKTRFRVDFSVSEGWQIPADSKAALLSSGLLADVFIGIREGESEQVLPPGAEIAAREGGDVFAAVGELAGEVTSLTRDKLTPLIEKLGKRLDNLSGTLEEGAPEMVQRTVALLDRLNEGAESIRLILGPENRATIDQMIADHGGVASNLRQLSADLNQTRQQLDNILGDIGESVDKARPDIEQAIVDLRVTLSAVAQRIDAITYNLESASRHVDEFSREIRKAPNRLLFSPEADPVKD
ncbi:MAG: MCE family protein [Xanthomonadales bacterium]|nr:MCE family protein [Xanthomonadales bacterium]